MSTSEKSPPPMSAEEQAWVAEIKPGITRTQLEKHFYLNAAGYDLRHAPYALHLEDGHGTVIKIKVGLRPKHMSPEIYQDLDRWLKWLKQHSFRDNPDDIVVTVSAPYREQPDTSID